MTEERIEIVRANPSHTTLVASLFDAYRQSYEQPSAMDEALAFIAERLAAGESVIFIALGGDSGSPEGAGFVQLYPSFSSVSLGRAWILNDLFVAPEYRRRGVARRLMERAIDHGRETGRLMITLETATDNTAAKPLYEDLGFVREEGFDHYELRL